MCNYKLSQKFYLISKLIESKNKKKKKNFYYKF
jgi:hypothetical protein